MNIIVFGAAGFIGKNLVMSLAKNNSDYVIAADQCAEYFADISKMNFSNIHFVKAEFDARTNFDDLLKDIDIVYHLVSTTVPTTSNQHVTQELMSNVITTSSLLDACVKCNVKKVVFISSGGTVYGKEADCPLKEDTATNPITSYGVQKVTIEKLLYLYNHIYGLDYRVIRLANPYGPYQRPNGILGAVTTFTYKALMKDKIIVYGDGSVVRDFIYIDDAVKGIIKIAEGENKYKTFNLGCGYGISIKEVLKAISETLEVELDIEYKEARKVDVPVNYLDISRYESAYGSLNPIKLKEGIMKTALFMKEYYNIQG